MNEETSIFYKIKKALGIEKPQITNVMTEEWATEIELMTMMDTGTPMAKKKIIVAGLVAFLAVQIGALDWFLKKWGK